MRAKNLKAVIIEDNSIVRRVLSISLNRFAQKTGYKIEVYSSDHIGRGLNLIFALDPELIIIDSTLPPHAKRDVLEFIKTSETLSTKKVLLLHEGWIEEIATEGLPKNYISLSKRDPFLVRNLIREINSILKFHKDEDELRFRLLTNLIQKANNIDLNENVKPTFGHKVYKVLVTLYANFITSVLSLRLSNIKDHNDYQLKKDKNAIYRYGRGAIYFASIFIFVFALQIMLLMNGGMNFFDIRVASVFETFNDEVKIDLNNSIYNEAEIQATDEKVNLILKTSTVIVEPENLFPESFPEENSENTTVVSYFETTPQEIIFEDEVSYSQINGIIEESTINDETSSLTFDFISDSPLKITYQLSPDGTNWYYFNTESIWELTTASYASSNTIQEINKNLENYDKEIGSTTKKLYIKAFLQSDGDNNIELNALRIKRNLDIVTDISPNPDTPIRTDFDTPESFPVESYPVSFPDINYEDPSEESSDEEKTLEDILDEADYPINDVQVFVHNASFANGNKIITGAIQSPTQAIPSSVLSKLKVQIVYTNQTDITHEITDVVSTIGEVDVQEYVDNGFYMYYWELIIPGQPGGYVGAMLKYNDIVVRTSRPVENSTFTVNMSGVTADISVGNGICDTNGALAGSQCTLRAAIQETTALGGSDNVFFNIPTTDSGYRDYDTHSTLSSGDGLGGDDYWYLGDTAGINFSGDTGGLVVDGTTQTLNQGDRNTNGPEIYLGGSTGTSSAAANVQIKSIVFRNGSSISIVDNLEFDGCYFNLDPKGIKQSSVTSSLEFTGTSAVRHGNITVKNSYFGHGNNSILIIPGWVSGFTLENSVLGVDKAGTDVVTPKAISINNQNSPVSFWPENINIGSPGNGNNIAASAGPAAYIFSGIFSGTTNIIDNEFNYNSATNGVMVSSGVTPHVGVTSFGDLNVTGNIFGLLRYSSFSGDDLDITNNFFGSNAAQDTFFLHGGVEVTASFASDSDNYFTNNVIANAMMSSNDPSCLEYDLNGVPSVGSMYIENNTMYDCYKSGIHIDQSEEESVNRPGDGPNDNLLIRNNTISDVANAGIEINGSSPEIKGNEIFNADYGVLSMIEADYNKSTAYSPNGTNGGFFSRPIIGGTSALVGSCNGTEQNCIYNTANAGIGLWESWPFNESTLYTDNDFSVGNNALAVEKLWYAQFEVFTGTTRRTDLTEQTITIDLPAGVKYYGQDRNASPITQLTNYLAGCAEDLCTISAPPTSGTEFETEILAPLTATSTYSLLYGANITNAPKIVQYEISQAGTQTNYQTTLKFEDEHLTSSQFSFDGNSLTDPEDYFVSPQTLGIYDYYDRGDTWTYNPTANGNPNGGGYSIGHFQVMELDLVDANPIWDGSKWVITVDTTTDEDNVSIEGLNDGDGAYSGGGTNGVNGIANGRTSLREAIIVSNNFGPTVTIEFNIPTSDTGYRDYDSANTPSSGDSTDGDDFWRILPTTDLPKVTDTTVIDATTQTSNQGDRNTFGPEIQLDGINDPNPFSTGLFFEGDTVGMNTLNGMNILNFVIAVSVQSEYATITNNYINIDAKGFDNTDGTEAAGIDVRNQFFDVFNVIIGTPGNGNVISSKGFRNAILVIGNDGEAYNIDSTIQSNKLGLTPAGNAKIDLTMSAISIAHKTDALIGGNTSAERNYIAGYINSGISIQPIGNVFIEIYNNFFGTDVSGNLDMSHSTNPFGANAIAWNHANVDAIAGTTIIGAPGKGNFIRNEQGNIGIYVSEVRNDNITIDSNTIFGKQGIFRGITNPGPDVPINIFRNYITHNDTDPDTYFGKSPLGVTGTSKDAGIYLSSGALIQGNYIEGYNNGVMFDYIYGLAEIGGQDPMANSLCQSSEKNCFRNITLEPTADYLSASILAAQGLPTNYATIYADNSFGYDVGVTEYPAYIAQFDASLELMSGTRRRTDLADSFFNFPLTQADAVFDSWNYTNYATSLVNAKVDCIDPLSCPASTGEDGKTVLFTVPDAIGGGTNAEYSGIYLSGVVIDPDGTVNVPFYNDYETDHLTMQKISFDGLLTDVQSQDNGEEGSITPSATGNVNLLVPQYWNPLILQWQDLRWNEIGEIHYVDANPIWDGDSWYITVESFDPVDNVSLEGFNDGDGTYSGGGTYGPDGLPNGITTLIEAQYVESQFPFPVDFVFTNLPDTDANPEFVSGEWVITVDTTTDEDNVSVDGFDDGDGAYSGGGLEGTDGLADGKTSLREAIIVANNFGETPDLNIKIKFDIPTTDAGYRDYDNENVASTGDGANGDDYWRIMPADNLPQIEANISIDGNTQTINEGDTNIFGPEIQLDGGLYSSFTDIGINLYGTNNDADQNLINGLNIRNFKRAIRIETLNTTVTNNYINTDAKGLDNNNGEGAGGIFVENINTDVQSVTVGTAGNGNVISSETIIGFGDGYPIFVQGELTESNFINVTIQANKIGLNATGTGPISVQRGINLQKKVNALIGGNTSAERNYIAYYTQEGILAQVDHGSVIEIYNNFFNTDITGDLDFNNVTTFKTAIYIAIFPDNAPSSGSINIGAVGKGNLIRAEGPNGYRGIYSVGNYSTDINIDSNTIFGKRPIIESNTHSTINILRNYLAYKDANTDPYFGKTPFNTTNTSNYQAIATSVDDAVTIQGNHIEGFNNGIVVDYAFGLAEVGGQGALANSLCQGLEKNCFVNNTFEATADYLPANILFAEGVPTNYSTIYADNNFSYDIGVPQYPAYVNQFDATLELMSGTRRRTDLADSFFNFPLTQADAVFDSWNYTNFATSLTNTKIDCLNPLSCPASSGEDGKTVLFTVPDAIGGIDASYTGIYLTGIVINPDGSSYAPFYNDYETDHLTMQKVSFDGRLTDVQPQDNGEEGTNNPAASGDPLILIPVPGFPTDYWQDLRRQEIAEIHYVDANPRWDGDSWYITVEAYDNIDQVSLEGFNDGDGVYSGGGTYGPDGLPDGVTTLIEAQYVATQFPFPVDFVYSVLPDTDANPQFISGEWVIEVTSTSDEDNVSTTGFDEGDGAYSGGGMDGVDGDADGKTSLREAIIVANNFSQPVKITFDIPTTDTGYRDYDDPNTLSSGNLASGDDYWRITPTTNLPSITDTTQIMGSTQTTNQSNSNTSGPEIQLDGINNPNLFSYGIFFEGDTGGTNILDGMDILNFNEAVKVESDVVTLTNNYINVDAKGLDINDNSDADGIRISNQNYDVHTVVIGTAGNGNVISAEGIRFPIMAYGIDNKPYYIDLTVQSNKIGLTASGTSKIDIRTGIWLNYKTNALIGGNTIAERNYIAGYQNSGIASALDKGSQLSVFNNLFGTDINGNLDLSNTTNANSVAITINGGGITDPIVGNVKIGEIGKGNLIRAEHNQGIVITGAQQDNITIDSNTIFGENPILRYPNNPGPDPVVNIFRNYLVYKDSNTDPYFGKTPLNAPTTSDRIGIEVSANALIQGNHIEGFNNGILFDYAFGLVEIGGQDPMANSLCSGTERNCFRNITYVPSSLYISSSILAAQGLPKNVNTIYADNSFGYDIGVTPYPAYIHQFDASLELMSGTRRRTDLADSTFSLPLTQQDAVFDSWNYDNYETTLVNTKVDCLDSLSCPASTGENGKTVLFTNPDALGAIDATYSGVYLTGLVISADGSSYVPFYNDYETEHLTMQSASFDGRLTDIQSQDNGEEATIAPSASGNPNTLVPYIYTPALSWQDLRWNEIAELHYVDANPRWDGDSWYITVESYDNVDQVSLEGFNDGDGNYSGGGTYGPDGLPNGITTLIEAQYVASQFPQPVEFIYSIIPTTDANPQFISGEWIIEVDSLTNEDNVSVLGYNDGSGVYTGGGITGADGQADGNTSLREAVIVAKKLNQNVRIITNLPGAFTPTNTITLISDNNSTITQIDGFDFDGTAQPIGSACVEITNAYNIEFIDSTFANCKEDGLRISAGTGNRITNTIFGSSVGGIAINLVGGSEDVNGQTANDAGDTDGGVNELLNTPEIISITYMGSSTYRIVGRIDGSVSEAPFDITICNSTALVSGYGTCIEELVSFTTTATPVVSGANNYFNWTYDLTLDGNDGTDQEEFSIFAHSALNSVSEIGTNFDTSTSPDYVNPDYEVTLNTPADNATLQTLTPTLSWNSNATNFHEFELYLDDELVATIAGNARQYTFPTNEALTEGEYTWYVVLKETISGTDVDLETTEERDFTIDIPTPPPPPPPPVIYTITTLTPKDVSIFELESIVFQWSAKTSNNSAPKFDQFNLRIFNANNELYDELVLNGTSNLYDYSFGLLEGDYKWEVVGVVTTTKNSIASDRASFKIVRDADVSEPIPDNNGEQPSGDNNNDNGDGFGGITLGFLKNIGDTLGLGTERTSEIGLGVLASVAVAGPLVLGLNPINLLAVLFTSVFRKKKKYWGIVFDSETSEVIPLSIIRLYKDNNYITQSISDFDGKFGFLINNEGNYMLEARSEGYETHNSGVNVGSDLEVAKDVELIKLGSGGPGFWSRLKANRKTAIKYLNRLLLLISLLGFINTIVVVSKAPTASNIAILIIYIVLLGVNFLVIVRSTLIRNRGRIVDVSTGEGLSSTSLRLYNDVQQVAILLTNKEGYLKTNIQPGIYKAIVTKPGYTYNDSADNKSIQITVNEKGYIEQEIKLKKI